MALIIVCSIISSIFYHAGGLSQEEKYWIPKWMRHSWVRDWICPFFCLLPLFIQHPNWLFIPTYGLMGAAFTTYWDKIFKFDNFWFAGFMVGMSTFPLVFCGIAWWLLISKCVFMAFSWGLWSATFGNDHIEEHGRGFFAGSSSLFLLTL